MREILFKSKTEGGRWIEGDLIHYESGEVAIFEKLSKYGYEVTEICKRTKVLSETICQYTGLKDKNGSKIWENDIVKKNNVNAFGYPRERFCVVSFDELGYWKITTTFGDGYLIGEFDNEQFEVVGNVFDNPELMQNT